MIGVKSLKSIKSRENLGIFVVEGERFVREIPKNQKVLQYVVSDKYKKSIEELKSRAPVMPVADGVFARIADTNAPQGILAVVEKKHYDIHSVMQNEGFVLALENLGDPSNIGGLIRTAAAADCGGILFTKGCVSVWNPKVLRGSAGATLKLPFAVNVDITEIIATARRQNIPVYAAHPKGDVLPYDINLTNRFCLILGNEAHGISQTVMKEACKLIKLPMNKNTESLSASVAGAVIMYEAVRQRLISMEAKIAYSQKDN